MTATEARPVLSGIVPAGESGPPPEGEAGGGPLYHSPIGLFEFQVDGVARTYWQMTQTDEPVILALWDTGVGKTHLAMATGAMMFEDDLIDQMIVVAETNKINDWAREDFPTFTGLSTLLYKGAPQRRRNILAKETPQVLVMTYETGKNDICKFRPRSKAVTGPEFLTEFLKGKRTLIVFDEFTKLRTRTSGNYIAWDYLINRVLRKDPNSKVMTIGMTASTVEKHPEDHWNAGRLLAPWRAGNVEWFYQTYVKSWDIYENPYDWKNLSAEDCAEGVTPLSQLFGPITLRKRKSDADVRDLFPKMVENPPTIVTLDHAQMDFYNAVFEAIQEEMENMDPGEALAFERSTFGLMRQIAGHPLSLLSSKGKVAQRIVAALGEETLRSIPATKMERMLDWQRRIGDQQSVIFTFFGQSILPHLATSLRQHGYLVSVNTGGMSADERFEQQRIFKAGETQIFLSSDAGARGLNLGVGSALLHYDLPVLYSVFVQRSNRIHRINSVHDSVTVDALVADDTIEDGIAGLLIKRNGWSDAVIDDPAYIEDWDPGEHHLTAEMRRDMMHRARRLAA